MATENKLSSSWIDGTILWPIEEAPQDGSVIIAVYDDASGVVALRYGLPSHLDKNEYRSGWWYSDWTEYYDDTLCQFMGWIKPPSEIRWHEEGATDD